MDDPAILFGTFILDPAAGRLLRDGAPVQMGHRGLTLLQALAEAQGKTVGKQALMDRVWPGQIVEEGNLTVQIAALRKAMGTDAEGREWIITVPREGYRLTVGASASSPPIRSALARRAAVPQSQRRHRAGLFRRRHCRGHHHRAQPVQELCRHRPQFDLSSTRAAPSMCGRWPRSLASRYVLEGSVRRAGDRLRISAQLVDGTSGAHLWAQNFDGAAEDIFDFQDRITESAAAMSSRKSSSAEIDARGANGPGASTPMIFICRRCPKSSPTGRRQCARRIEFLERALALDPAFAPAGNAA